MQKFLTQSAALILICLLLGFSSPVKAELYAGIDLGTTTIDNTAYKDNQTLLGAGRLFVGTMFNESVGMEIAGGILGNFHRKNVSIGYYIAVDILELIAVGRWELVDDVTLTASAGFYNWTDESFSDKQSVGVEHGSDLCYGIGIDYQLSRSWSIGVKTQQYEQNNANIKLYALRAAYYF